MNANIVLMINVPSVIAATKSTILTAVLLIVIHAVIFIPILVILSVLLDTSTMELIAILVATTILLTVWNVRGKKLVNNAPMAIIYGKVNSAGRDAMNALIIASIVRIRTLALHVNIHTFFNKETAFSALMPTTQKETNPT